MSNIQWCDITANPIHLIREDGSHGGHWCQKVSPGCANCYAEAQNQSNYFKFASHLPYSGSAPDNLIFDDKVMQELLKTRSPKKVFLCSMTDLFGEWVLDEWLDRAFVYMRFAPQHTFQILTKRPERMKEYLSDPKKIRLPNVWIGTSVENQKAARDRIPSLLMTPASVRFLSCEPLLEAIEIEDYLRADTEDLGHPGINLVIVGGESGSRARPCYVESIRSLVGQCKRSDTAVFVKQLGSMPIESTPYILDVATSNHQLKLKDRKGGNIDEFPEDLQVREFPN